MKRYLLIVALVFMSRVLVAQTQEAQQLLLNWEKLMQFKEILQNMYDGWKVIDKGYKTIKDISAGNFSLHKGFLDALMEVSPVVKRYKRITDIVNYQINIVKRGKAAFQLFKDDGMFSAAEILYLEKVYGNLFSESVKNLDELFLVTTAGQLRMSDDERLRAIDQIYARVVDQFSFLEDFNSSTGTLLLQRKAERAEIEMERKLGRRE
jgi:hypothetical protein